MRSHADEFVVEMDAVDDTTCWRMLIDQDVGRVGFVDESGLQIRPVNFAVLDRSLLFRTTDDSRLASLPDGTAVVFEADHTERVAESGWSVLVRGNAQHVPNADEDRQLRELALHPWAPGSRDHWVRIAPTSISGRTIHRRRVRQPGSAVAYMPPD